MIGAKVGEAVAVMTVTWTSCAEDCGFHPSELESRQRASRDMMCLEYLKRVLMGVTWKRSYCMLVVVS